MIFVQYKQGNPLGGNGKMLRSHRFCPGVIPISNSGISEHPKPVRDFLNCPFSTRLIIRLGRSDPVFEWRMNAILFGANRSYPSPSLCNGNAIA
jgi:hypothetical protein